MYDVAMREPGDAFRTCWSEACRHLAAQPRSATMGWIKSNPSPPFLEHLSFRLGNQLFFVQLHGGGDGLDWPGSAEGLFHVADQCGGHACVLPMRLDAGDWRPSRRGWGLIDARSGEDIDPPSLVTTAKIEMTDWEVQDFAVQIMRAELKKSKFDILGFNGDPEVKPSIWFERQGRREWLAVASTRFPTSKSFVPAEWTALAQKCKPLSDRGYFASVRIASADDPAMPLWRDHALTAQVMELQVVPAP